MGISTPTSGVSNMPAMTSRGVRAFCFALLSIGSSLPLDHLKVLTAISMMRASVPSSRLSSPTIRPSAMTM